MTSLKKQLAEAVDLTNKGKNVVFHFEHRFKDGDFLQSLCFGKQLSPGDDDDYGKITLPISQKQFQKLKSNMSEPILHGMGMNRVLDSSAVQASQIDASKILSTYPEDFFSTGLERFASSAVQHLGFPSAIMTVESQVVKLLLFEVGDHHKGSFDQDVKPGNTVGTMLLQIPIEGGHKGGAIKLKHHEKIKRFLTSTESNRRFSLVAFHSSCQQELEPVTSGAMALLVIRLVWTNPPIENLLHPLDIPAFIESLAAVQKCFDRLFLKPTGEKQPENDDDPYHRDHANEEGLFFFLKNKYANLTKLKWSSLKGRDCWLGLLFRCCPSVDVHLTVVEQKFEETWSPAYKKDDPLLTTSSNWIHPEIGPVHMSGMNGYPRGRLIDKKLTMHEMPPKNRKPDREEKENGKRVRFSYFTPALCVWPKKESFRMYSKYGFDTLLDLIESSQDDGLDNLCKLLDVVNSNPAQVWRDAETGGAERAGRLLRFCLKLGAKEQGLRLLGLLNAEFSTNNGQKTFEGIRDDRVALAVAEFECRVAGWEDCSGPLLAIFSKPDRVEKQLVPFTTLIRLLKDKYNCFQGAVQLSQAIDSIILCSDNPPKLTPIQVNKYLDLCLEEDMKTSNPGRMPLIGPFCCNKLNTLQQCFLATHLAVRHSALPLFTELLTSLAHNGTFSDAPQMSIQEIAVKLLFCYLDAGLAKLLKKLTPKLMMDSQAARVILESPRMWNRATLPDGLGRAQLISVLPAFVTKRIDTLKNLVMKHPNPLRTQVSNPSCYNLRSNVSLQDRQRENNIRMALSSSLGYVIRLVNMTVIKDHQKGLIILRPLLCKMSPGRLCQLVADSLAYKKETPEAKSLVLGICQRVRLVEPLDPDTVAALLEVFSGQREALDGFINSLVKSLRESGPAAHLSIFTSVVSYATGWMSRTPADLPVIKGITSKLMDAWISAVVSKGNFLHAEPCLEMFITLKNAAFRPEINPAPLSTFIVQMSKEIVLQLVSLLHSVIVEWDRPATGESAHYAQLGRNLIKELLGRANARDVLKPFNSASEVLHCLIWLGEGVLMDSFIAMLSTTRDGEQLAVQLALSVGNHCADLSVHHPAGLKVCWYLLDHCIEGLGRIWKKAEAKVPDYPEVENFLRSANQSMILDGFENRIEDARLFCEKLQRSYRVSATIQGSSEGKKKWKVAIEKMKNESWLAECSTDWFHYEDRQKKLDILMALRQDQPIANGATTSTPGGIKRSADLNAGQPDEESKQFLAKKLKLKVE